MNCYIELLRVALGQRQSLTSIPSEEEWRTIYEEAKKHALIGVAFRGIEALPKEQRPPKSLLLQWYSQVNYIEQRNHLLDARSKEISELFKENGFRTCVLKGQSLSLLYSKFGLAGYRMPGDIDLLVDGNREEILNFLKNRYEVTSIVYHHADSRIFKDVETEIHYFPSYSYNPFRCRM